LYDILKAGLKHAYDYKYNTVTKNYNTVNYIKVDCLGIRLFWHTGQ